MRRLLLPAKGKSAISSSFRSLLEGRNVLYTAFIEPGQLVQCKSVPRAIAIADSCCLRSKRFFVRLPQKNYKRSGLSGLPCFPEARHYLLHSEDLRVFPGANHSRPTHHRLDIASAISVWKEIPLLQYYHGLQTEKRF